MWDFELGFMGDFEKFLLMSFALGEKNEVQK